MDLMTSVQDDMYGDCRSEWRRYFFLNLLAWKLDSMKTMIERIHTPDRLYGWKNLTLLDKEFSAGKTA